MYQPKAPILESLTPFSRLLFSVLMIISCFAITFFAGLLLAPSLFGVKTGEVIALLGNLEDAKSINLLQYFQVLQSFGLFIFPVLLSGYFFERSSTRYLHLDKPSRWQVWLLTLCLMFIALPFINWMVDVNEMMKLPSYLKGMEDWMKSSEDQASKLTEVFMKMPTIGAFAFNLLMIAILPAIGEEFLFRGLLQRLLKELTGNIHAAIFISAFFFSAMHMQFYGFLPRMLLGMLFGYLFYWSGSLWVPVWAHLINNGTVVIVAFLCQHRVINGNYENFGSTDNVFLIVGSALLAGCCLWLIHRFRTVTPLIQPFPEINSTE
ncbi:MAG: CPBP family intramembrane glutamic endopeptidase [Bacteroidota bacterium]